MWLITFLLTLKKCFRTVSYHTSVIRLAMIFIASLYDVKKVFEREQIKDLLHVIFPLMYRTILKRKQTPLGVIRGSQSNKTLAI